MTDKVYTQQEVDELLKATKQRGEARNVSFSGSNLAKLKYVEDLQHIRQLPTFASAMMVIIDEHQRQSRQQSFDEKLDTILAKLGNVTIAAQVKEEVKKAVSFDLSGGF